MGIISYSDPLLRFSTEINQPWSGTVIKDELFISYNNTQTKINVYDVNTGILKRVLTIPFSTISIGTNGIELLVKNSSNQICAMDSTNGSLKYTNSSPTFVMGSGNFTIQNGIIFYISSGTNTLNIATQWNASIIKTYNFTATPYGVVVLLDYIIVCANPGKLYVGRIINGDLSNVSFVEVYSSSVYLSGIAVYKNTLYLLRHTALRIDQIDISNLVHQFLIKSNNKIYTINSNNILEECIGITNPTKQDFINKGFSDFNNISLANSLTSPVLLTTKLYKDSTEELLAYHNTSLQSTYQVTMNGYDSGLILLDSTKKDLSVDIPLNYFNMGDNIVNLRYAVPGKDFKLFTYTITKEDRDTFIIKRPLDRDTSHLDPLSIEKPSGTTAKIIDNNVNIYIPKDITNYINSTLVISDDKLSSNIHYKVSVNTFNSEYLPILNTDDYGIVIDIPKSSLNEGTNTLVLYIKDINTGVEKSFNYIFNKDKDDISVSEEKFTINGVNGDVELYAGEGIGIKTLGSGDITIEIPTDGKNGIKKITVNPVITNSATTSAVTGTSSDVVIGTTMNIRKISGNAIPKGNIKQIFIIQGGV